MTRFHRFIGFLLVCFGISSAAFPGSTTAQSVASAPCGVVDEMDYPLDISETLDQHYDDFALYRARFGGMHTGIDIAFNRHYEPVYAAARGRVTYADPEGWDTEKGVVIVEHIFPDGSTAYTLYGHMEQTESILFPRVNSCVERGDIVGTVGWPSRGLPHLHYEIRNFMPGDGGPGYVTDNPTLLGWYHPLDFTDLWRVRLAPGYIGSITFTDVPTLPPIVLDSGVFVIASGNALEGFVVPDRLLWRVTADGVITGVAGLPGDRVVARTRSGQMLLLQGGRYAAVWSVSGPEASPLEVDGTLLVLTDGGGIGAYLPEGQLLWELPGETTIVSAETDVVPPRVEYFERNGSEIVVAIRAANTVSLRIFDTFGTVLYQTAFEETPVIAPLPSGGWLVLAESTLYRIKNGERAEVTTISPTPGRWARMVSDAAGNTYVYVGDSTFRLLAIDAAGEVLWRAAYPNRVDVLSPVMAVGNNCLLYSLDVDGTLNVFSTLDGDVLGQRQIYAGGDRNGSPRARILQVDGYERLTVGGGFLTTVALDGRALAGDDAPDCSSG